MKLKTAIDAFFQGYFSTHDRQSKTIQAYKSDLAQFDRFFPDRELGSVSPEDVEAWALELKGRGYEPTSVRRKMASLRTFFGYWARRNVLTSSPFWRLRLNLGKNRNLPRTLPPAEIEGILGRATREAATFTLVESGPRVGEAFATHRNLAIVELLFATGIRVGELVALRMDDVSLAERSILVQGKGGRQRLAFLAEPTSFAVISAYLAARARISADTKALFINSKARPISAQAVARIIHRLARGAGLTRRVTPHMFRHTIATMLLRNGVDLRIVQEFLGHASITMTQRYTHVSSDQVMHSLKQRHPRLTLGQ